MDESNSTTDSPKKHEDPVFIVHGPYPNHTGSLEVFIVVNTRSAEEFTVKPGQLLRFCIQNPETLKAFAQNVMTAAGQWENALRKKDGD